jgi:flagellar basal body-associated protein FliL
MPMDYEILFIVMTVLWIVSMFGAALFILRQAAQQEKAQMEFVKIIKAQSLSEYTANNAKPPPHTKNFLRESMENAAKHQPFRTGDDDE